MKVYITREYSHDMYPAFVLLENVKRYAIFSKDHAFVDFTILSIYDLSAMSVASNSFYAAIKETYEDDWIGYTEVVNAVEVSGEMGRHLGFGIA